MNLQEVQQPTEGIKLETNHVQAYFRNDSLGNGTLYITNRAVTWINSAPGSKGFSFAYPAIILHATSSDLSVFPSEHLLVIVDQRKSVPRRRRAPVLRTIQEAQEQEGMDLAVAELDGEESDDDEVGSGLEIRFVPDDKSTLTSMYHEIIVGQEENPEEDDPMFDDEEEVEGEEEMEEGQEGQMPSGQWFTSESDMAEFQLSDEGMANLNRMLGHGRGDQDEAME